MPMAVTLSQATAAAWQDGQASAVTARVLRVAGVPTAQCPAAVRMEVPAPQRTEAASVPLASEDPYVRESAHQGSTAMAAPSLVLSACTAAGPATTSVASVSACQDSLEPCATKCVLEGTSGRTVPSSAPVPTTGPAAPSMVPVSVFLGGLARTAHRPAHLGSGALPASIHAAATTGRAAAPRMGPATAPLAGLDSSARSVAPQHFLGRIVGTYASVRTEPAVTTLLGNAPVEQASLGATVNRDVPRERLDTGVSSSVSA